MEFREFIENEEAALFDEGIEHIDEWLGSALKFAAGATGNALSQTGRAIGNVSSGVLQGTYGIGQGVLSAAQRAGGGHEEAEKTFRRASDNIGSGIGKVARGIAQGVGVATGVSPILRGAQAVSEPMLGITGLYAPGSKDRTAFQDLVGLDSWKDGKNADTKEKKGSDERTTKPKAVRTQKPADPKPFLKELERKEKQDKAPMRRVDPDRPKPQPEEWKRLVDMYKAAKTKEERDEIRRKMILVNPYLYQQAVEAGKRRAAAKAGMGRAV
jgi:hypothetical protein